MKPSDWLLSLQDVLGKLLPGIILILEISWFKNSFPFFKSINIPNILGFSEINAPVIKSTLIVIILFMVAYVVGGFSTLITFRLIRDKNSGKIRKDNKIEKLSAFFKNGQETETSIIRDSIYITFSEVFKSSLSLQEKGTPKDEKAELKKRIKAVKKITYHKLSPFCKNYLLPFSPQSFNELKRIEAYLNFYTGMLIPFFLFLLIIFCELIPKTLAINKGLGVECFRLGSASINIWGVMVITSGVMTIIAFLVINHFCRIYFDFLHKETESENYVTFTLFHSAWESRKKEMEKS